MLTHRKYLALIAALALSPLVAADEAAPKQPQEEAANNEEINTVKVSEAFGHFIGRNLKSPGIDFDIESIIKGIRSGAAGEPAPMSDQEYEMAMSKMQERAFSALAKDNLSKANAFMAENAKDKNVVVLEEGKLQYTTLKEGDGAVVAAHSAPLIHYTGKYLDGTVFGSSEEVGGPITIPLDQTIPGFSKGLLGMKEGEKRRLFVHPDLGYGTLGNLPPNALLIFDVEIIKADTAKGAESGVAANDLYDDGSDFDELTSGISFDEPELFSLNTDEEESSEEGESE